jgi:1-acyl-sn-glycerol-3-phosphate acyltransferase
MVYPISKFWLYPFCSVFTKRIKGIKNIPQKSNFIMISNHENRIDPIYLIYLTVKILNKKIHFLAQPKLWFLGKTICSKWAGCIPLFNSKQAYNQMKDYLKRGKLIGIFPQGNYKKDNNKNFKTGALRLALETNTPILPVGISSSYTPFATTINIGKLIHLKKRKKSFDQQITSLMNHIHKLKSI